jgi:NAD(P)H dehydrogenase (quinone)
MLTHIVYAHPSHDGFTYDLLTAFTEGLDEAGLPHTVSDLYQAGFDPLMSAAEREWAGTASDLPVPADVAAEQAKLEAADVWAFVYPVWWMDCPAILKGWFDRVWTASWFHDPPALQPARRAVVLCTAGHTPAHLRDDGGYQAMETVMLTDRIHDRATAKEFHLFGGSVATAGDEWQTLRRQHLDTTRNLGRTMANLPHV